MDSLLMGSTVGTPWYCAYVRSTIGAVANVESAKQYIYIMKLLMKDHIFRSRKNRKLDCSYLYCWKGMSQLEW